MITVQKVKEVKTEELISGKDIVLSFDEKGKTPIKKFSGRKWTNDPFYLSHKLLFMQKLKGAVVSLYGERRLTRFSKLYNGPIRKLEVIRYFSSIMTFKIPFK